MTSDTRSTFVAPLRRLGVAAFSLGVFAAAQAFAQSATGPPRPTQPDDPPTFIYYGVFAVLALLTIGVSLIPSKRGHLD
ncbi:MAG: hypothetical protein ACTS27_08900 [Phycisphaerales bacterium]